MNDIKKQAWIIMHMTAYRFELKKVLVWIGILKTSRKSWFTFAYEGYLQATNKLSIMGLWKNIQRIDWPWQEKHHKNQELFAIAWIHP